MGDLGTRIRKLRRDRNLTQLQLANAVGITQSYLSDLERGVEVNPSRDVIRALARELEIDPRELLEAAWEADGSPPLPGTEDLPAVFAGAIQRARHRLTARQWTTAATFLDWLAAQGPNDPPQPPAAYGYGAGEEPEPTDVEQKEHLG